MNGSVCVAIAALVAILGLAGCSGAGSPTALSATRTSEDSAEAQTHEFVYVANWNTDSVSGYSVDERGQLTPVAGSPFAAGDSPDQVTLDAAGPYLHVSDRNSKSISAYEIHASGELTAVAGSPFATYLIPGALAADPKGRFLYALYHQYPYYTYVAGFSVAPKTGALAPLSNSPFRGQAQPNFMASDPTGSFAYVVNGSPSGVYAYTIDPSSNALAVIPNSPFPAGPYPGAPPLRARRRPQTRRRARFSYLSRTAKARAPCHPRMKTQRGAGA
jgi:6-phosphogluconolactonase